MQSNTLVKILLGVIGAVVVAGVLAAVAVAIVFTATKAKTGNTEVTSEKMIFRVKFILKTDYFDFVEQFPTV